MKPGDIIGEWQVDRTLGRGGMGMVFLCHHVNHPEEVAAVKLFTALSANEDGFRRSERELEVLSRLDHPGIVPLKPSPDTGATSGHDADGDTYWMAMEYIQGPSLESRLDHGPVPAGYAAGLFHTLAEALEHAHSRGVFHRDIKPANIVLGDDGVRLVDFGIALQEEKTRLTAVGNFAGTLPYMPPEVVVEDRVRPDPILGDIYALGVVLYEALTAQRAFQTERGLSDRDRQMRILRAKMSEEVLDPGPEIPSALRELVRQATAPRPENRIQSWSEFRYWLEQVPVEADAHLPMPERDPAEPQDDLRGPSPVTASGYRRRVPRPARGLRLGRKGGPETVTSGTTAASAMPAPTPPATSMPPSPTGVDLGLGVWNAEDAMDSGFTQLPTAPRRDPEPTEPTELTEQPALAQPDPWIAPAPAPVTPVPQAPPPAPRAAPEAPLKRPVTAATKGPRPGSSGGPTTLDRLQEQPTAPTRNPMAEPVAVSPPPPPPVSAPPAAARVAPRAVAARAPEPAAPPPAVATASSGVTSAPPAPVPTAAQPDESSSNRTLLLVLLAAAIALLFVGGAGVAWWVSQGTGSAPVASSPAGAPGAAPAGASGTPSGASMPPTGGGASAAAGAAASDAEDGLADAGWNDTGLKEATLPWGGAGAAVAAAASAPQGGSASPSGPRAAPKAEDATAAKTMKKKVFFTVDGGGNADIYVNGQRRGSAPLTLFLEPGEYSIAFRGEGGEQTKDIEVASYGANEYRYEPKKRRITNIHQ